MLWIFWNVWTFTFAESKENFWNFILPGNVVMLCGNFCYYVVQYFLMKNFYDIDRMRFSGVLCFYGIGPIFGVILNFFFNPTKEMSIDAALQMFNYHILFFSQGMFVYNWADFLHADVYHIR